MNPALIARARPAGSVSSAAGDHAAPGGRRTRSLRSTVPLRSSRRRQGRVGLRAGHQLRHHRDVAGGSFSLVQVASERQQFVERGHRRELLAVERRAVIDCLAAGGFDQLGDGAEVVEDQRLIDVRAVGDARADSPAMPSSRRLSAAAASSLSLVGFTGGHARRGAIATAARNMRERRRRSPTPRNPPSKTAAGAVGK